MVIRFRQEVIENAFLPVLVLRVLPCTNTDAPAMEATQQQQFITHIEYRRLLDLACGRAKIEEREQDHLHGCRVCRSVYVYLNQTTPSEKFESEDEAA